MCFTSFTQDEKQKHLHPLTSGFCRQWESVKSSFIHGSDNSAVVTGVYLLQLQSAVMVRWHLANFCLFFPTHAEVKCVGLENTFPSVSVQAAIDDHLVGVAF